MRAGIYVRISRDIAGEGLGVQRQQEDCLALAKQLGWEVAEVYVDNDVSATKGKPRPAYQRMLADLESSDIGAIVAWHADRLYRKLPDLLGLVETVKKTNAQIATCQSGDLDLSSPTGRMIATILASVATQEVEHKSERWSRSWQQGRERGAPVTNSNRLFGYERDGATVVPKEAAIANQMVDMLLAGQSINSVVRWLHEQGVETTRGGVWRNAGLKVYLTNPRIAGWSTHKGEIVAEGAWLPIVDRDRWEEVRALLTSRTAAPMPRKNLLPGLAFCGLCGTRLISGRATSRRNGETKSLPIYRCPVRPNFDGCGGISVFCHPVDEIVETYARERLADPAVMRRVAELRAHPSGAQNELAALDQRILDLEHQLDRPGVPVASLLRAIERAKARQEELLAQVVTMPRVELPRQGGEWPDDLRRRRELIELVVGKVEIVKAPRLRNAFNPERVKIKPR